MGSRLLVLLLLALGGHAHPGLSSDLCMESPLAGYRLDTVGQEFLVVNMDTSLSPRDLHLAMVTQTCEDVSTLLTKGGVTETVEVPARDHAERLDHAIQESSPLPLGKSEGRAVIVEADDDISVHGHYRIGDFLSSFIHLPVDVLGRDYTVVMLVSNPDTTTDLVIVAYSDNTQVSIQLPRQPDVDHIPGDDLIVHDDSAVTFTYHQTMSTNLHSLETYKIRAQSGSLTGTLVHSTRDVAVFLRVTDAVTGRVLIWQLSPDHTLGKTLPIVQGTTKFVAIEPQTTVNLATGESALLQNIGDIFTTAQALTYLTSDKPLASIGSLNGHFIVWPALENMIHGSLTFTTLSTDHVTGNVNHVMIVLTDTAFRNDLTLDTIRLNDLYSTGCQCEWTELTDSRYSFTTVPIAPGVHTLTQSVTGAGFLIGVFALDESEDVIYIHQAGFRLRDNTCRVSTPVVGDNRDNDCDGDVDEEICSSGLDRDEDGQLDEDCLTGPVIDQVEPDLEPSPEIKNELCCHGSVCHLSCPEGQTIRIIQSHYGRYSYIGENTCGVRAVDSAVDVPCGLHNTNHIFEPICNSHNFCDIEITSWHFHYETECALRALYAVVDYICIPVDEVHCTVPATRSVRSFLDMAGAQWQASKPPTQPAYAHAELLLHHGNNDNADHANYVPLTHLGTPADACLPEFASMTAGLNEWCSDECDNQHAYIQVFIGGPHRVTAVVLQGARTEEYWVTKFRLEYSSDLSGNTWAAVTDGYDSVIFEGNRNARDTVLIPLSEHSFTARYIRLYVVGYHRYPALHVEFLRCQSVDGCQWLSIDDSNMVDRSAAIGESHTATCDQYHLSSTNNTQFTVTCGTDGEWEGVDACLEPSCGPFRNIHDLGGLPFSAPPYFANDFRYLGAAGSTTCDGFDQLIGIVPIRCHPLAAFKPAAVCQLNTKVQCVPPTIENAVANVFTVNVGSTFYYACLEGYTMIVGDQVLACEPNGQISGTLPVCTAVP